MPFAPYQSSFNSDSLRILQEAFDQAWAEVAASPSVTLDEQAARNMIANRIVHAWRDQGERDPERLKQHAVEGL
ncbi:MAG: hypothetical protein WD928_05040 [Gammaproteobacteria bacterium]